MRTIYSIHIAATGVNIFGQNISTYKSLMLSLKSPIRDNLYPKLKLPKVEKKSNIIYSYNVDKKYFDVLLLLFSFTDMNKIKLT